MLGEHYLHSVPKLHRLKRVMWRLEPRPPMWSDHGLVDRFDDAWDVPHLRDVVILR